MAMASRMHILVICAAFCVPPPCYRSATPLPAQILLVYIFHETRSLRMLQFGGRGRETLVEPLKK